MLSISLIIIISHILFPAQDAGRSPILISRMAVIAFLYSGALAYNVLYIQFIGSGIGIYNGLFICSTTSLVFDIVICLFAALCLSSFPVVYFQDREADNNINYLVPEHALILMFSTIGSCLLVSAADLFSVYLALELQSFGVYIISSIFRKYAHVVLAGLKYFLLGSLSSCIILLGIGLVYSYSGLTSLEAIYSFLNFDLRAMGAESLELVTLEDSSIVTVNELVNLSKNGVEIGLLLIIIGFLFKIAAAPLHNWAPDVYNDVPTLVTLWISTMPKISIIVLLSGIITSLCSNDSTHNLVFLKDLLLLSSFLSLWIGGVVGLNQMQIKRLLTFSTISHIGFMLLAMGINTPDSLEALYFYLIQYSLTNINVFLILLGLSNMFNDNMDIKDLRQLVGVFKHSPLMTLSLAITLFSLAGIPPLLGFFAKQKVLFSAISNGYFFMAAMGIAVSVISGFYYLRFIKGMHFYTYDPNNIFEVETHKTVSQRYQNIIKNSIDFYPDKNLSVVQISNVHSFLISLITLSLVFFIFKPNLILNSIHLMALYLYNF